MDDPNQVIAEIKERLAKLETDSEWMKKNLGEIKQKLDSIIVNHNEVKTLKKVVWIMIFALIGLIVRSFLA